MLRLEEGHPDGERTIVEQEVRAEPWHGFFDL
jgi:hypothetical protein